MPAARRLTSRGALLALVVGVLIMSSAPATGGAVPTGSMGFLPQQPLGAVVAQGASQPTVASDDSGRLTVAWTRTGGGVAVTHGTLTGGFDAPSTVTADSTTTSPHLVVDAAGDAVIAWESEKVIPNPNQKYPNDPATITVPDAVWAAQAPAGQPFAVPKRLGATAGEPLVAANPAGDAVIVWPGIGRDMYARVARGGALGGALALPSAFNAQSVALSPTGQIVVAGTSPGSGHPEVLTAASPAASWRLSRLGRGGVDSSSASSGPTIVAAVNARGTIAVMWAQLQSDVEPVRVAVGSPRRGFLTRTIARPNNRRTLGVDMGAISLDRRGRGVAVFGVQGVGIEVSHAGHPGRFVRARTMLGANFSLGSARLAANPDGAATLVWENSLTDPAGNSFDQADALSLNANRATARAFGLSGLQPGTDGPDRIDVTLDRSDRATAVWIDSPLSSCCAQAAQGVLRASVVPR